MATKRKPSFEAVYLVDAFKGAYLDATEESCARLEKKLNIHAASGYKLHTILRTGTAEAYLIFEKHTEAEQSGTEAPTEAASVQS